jgi:L-lysine exporter family protein LysE/ArgO
MSLSFIQGFGMGGGLIVAIGAQNAFVLSQGVRRNYPLAIALVCACCDSVLILLGVSGVGAAVAANPLLGQFTVWGGALFLLWYGALACRSAWQGGSLETNGVKVTTLRAVLTTTLAITLLNPHVYLDTIVLLGGISGQFPMNQRLLFGAGAITASFIWFFSLSFAAGMLAPIFRKKSAWRVLDGVVCLTMWSIAVSLLWSKIT